MQEAQIDVQSAKKSQKNIEVLCREKSVGISSYIEEVLDQLQPLEYFVEDAFDSEALTQILDEDLPSGSCNSYKEEFIEDLVEVSHLFFQKSAERKIHIQFNIVTTNMCRLFHVDSMTQRLLCTYRGQGTEWLDDSNVSRSGLCKGDNNKIVKSFDRVNRAREFDILILQGKKSLIAPEGAVHRSPQIEDTCGGEKRVLLKIDEK